MMLDQPPELRDEPEDSRKLPNLEDAARRVHEFLSAFGDGIIFETWERDVNDPHIPLYARDLEILARHARETP